MSIMLTGFKVYSQYLKVKQVLITKQKFLVFRASARPDPTENWLLDIELAHDDFSTDQAALWLAELDLPSDFRQVVLEHEGFFNSSKRRTDLKKTVEKRDSAAMLRLKMAAVCAGCNK